MFQYLKLWISIMVTLIKNKWLPSAKKEEKVPKLLPLDLQFFADGGSDDDHDDQDDDSDDDDDQDDGPNLDELMKDPKFKKQYQAKLKEQLGKRMKKFQDVDPEEYRRLKGQADKKKAPDKEDEDDELENLKSEAKEKEQKLLRAERREKRAAVKEFAVDNGFNQKLLARLIDIDKVELDEEGEPDNLEELFEEIQEEFPEYFSDQDDDDDEEDEEEDKKSKKKSSRYAPGSKQKGNTKRQKDKRSVGAQRAAARHKKEDK
ncbi:hypothetical protein [Metabacillus litoralis]|uniref:hypothetical protein n=1 Tax=Metabacillus litoralis TaxID=152268 RepID=UPI002040E627|nr:hypothetical protein [Metabacillus litoralis]MCM3651323.1 hypothetical protein [Metabacillus litoralis]